MEIPPVIGIACEVKFPIKLPIATTATAIFVIFILQLLVIPRVLFPMYILSTAGTIALCRKKTIF